MDFSNVWPFYMYFQCFWNSFLHFYEICKVFSILLLSFFESLTSNVSKIVTFFHNFTKFPTYFIKTFCYFNQNQVLIFLAVLKYFNIQIVSNFRNFCKFLLLLNNFSTFFLLVYQVLHHQISKQDSLPIIIFKVLLIFNPNIEPQAILLFPFVDEGKFPQNFNLLWKQNCFRTTLYNFTYYFKIYGIL